MSKRQSGVTTIRAVDIFCGAGGSSRGAHDAGVEIAAAIDLSELAGKTHQTNFPSFLGRVIHSRELTILRASNPQVGTKWANAPNITVYHTALALAVRSDYDKPDDAHLAKIDELLQGFLTLCGRLEAAVKYASVC